MREGQGVVLMCTPPPHSPGKSLVFQSQAEEEIHFLLLLPLQCELLLPLFIFMLCIVF